MLTAALASAITGCSAGSATSPAEPQVRKVIAWDQGKLADLGRAGPEGIPALHTQLLQTTAERARMLAQLPASVPATEKATVEAIDLTTHAIVVGVYHKCTEVGQVDVDAETLRFRVENPTPGTNCAWAPLQVELWSVDRSGLPTPIQFVNQQGGMPPD